MPKSVPKQKPLATKMKKLPISILSLLGVALLLAGIVAAIGLLQMNQDGRSNASSSCTHLYGYDRAKCEEKRANEKKAQQQADREAAIKRLEQEKGKITPTLSQVEKLKLENAANTADFAKLEAELNQGNTNNLKDFNHEPMVEELKDYSRQQSAQNPTGSTTNTTAKPSSTTKSTSAAPTPRTTKNTSTNTSGASQTNKSLGQPYAISTSCKGSDLTVRWRMNGGSASAFVVALSTAYKDGCSNMKSGWMCDGDIQKDGLASSKLCSGSSCSYTVKIVKGRTYNAVAVRAVRGTETKVDQKTGSIVCN